MSNKSQIDRVVIEGIEYDIAVDVKNIKNLEDIVVPNGKSIHIGDEAPIDENVNVWIDTDEEPEEIPTGKDGKDGVSATHEWNGTVLTITSASGTSSADLKGEKGDTGATGPQGPKGNTGETGATGATGKTAYEYAKQGGYTGSESAFAEKLAAETRTYVFSVTGNPRDGYISSKSYGTVRGYYEQGWNVECDFQGEMMRTRLHLDSADALSLVFSKTLIPSVFATVTLHLTKGVTAYESILDMKIGSQTWGMDEPIDFTDTINGMIDEKVSSIPSGGGGSGVDVIAEVGQTIIVKAVDKNGKPTKWEAVDYQPRTHYTAPKKVLAENVTPSMMSNSWISYDLVKDYTAVTVVFDGTTYVCPIIFVENITDYGDESFFFIGNYDNRAPEYPFSFFGYIGKDFALVSPYSGHTYSVTTNEYVHKLDDKYLPATGSAASASDWNASEGEAGHIKNRTHWIEGDNALLFDGDTDSGGNIEDPPINTYMSAGKTYELEWDGVVYKDTARYLYEVLGIEPYSDYTLPDGGILRVTSYDIVWGDLSYYFGGDPTMPVSIDSTDKDMRLYNMGGIDGVRHIAIYGVEVVHKLDPKFYERLAWVESAGADPYFDNNFSGHEVLELELIPYYKTYLVKVSDYVPTEEKCIGAEIVFDVMGTNIGGIVPQNGVVDVSATYGIPGFMVFTEESLKDNTPFVAVVKQAGTVMETNVSAGTYYLSTGEGAFYTSYFSALDVGEVVHKIDNKFIDAEWMATRSINKSVSIIEEAEREFFSTTTENGIPVATNIHTNWTEIKLGSTYVVVWDDKEYQCKAMKGNDTWYYLGYNHLASGGNTGEPFSIVFSAPHIDPLDRMIIIVSNNPNQSTHKVGIYEAEEVVNKLPEEFLPAMPVVVSMKSMDESTETITMSHTGEEVRDLVWGNKIVFANALGMPFIATGIIHEINGIPNAEFAYFLDPAMKCLLDENGVFKPLEE